MNRSPGDNPPLISGSLEHLRRRDLLARQAREFFFRRGYWEVETPQASRDCCVDAHIDPAQVQIAGESFYLQTSPEFGMKRLLASGSGSIMQFARAFRLGEQGRWHNPEFTLLEWYKVGANDHELMDEIDHLLRELLHTPPARKTTYRQAFVNAWNLDPLTTPISLLEQAAIPHGWRPPTRDRDDLLNFLWGVRIEERLGQSGPEFLHDYPASQAALARTHADVDGQPLAHRFELYLQGIELCNGYWELSDADELTERFRTQNEKRRQLGKPPIPVESRFLDAMRTGLPDCAGVALGWDRLVTIACQADGIQTVISITTDIA